MTASDRDIFREADPAYSPSHPLGRSPMRFLVRVRMAILQANLSVADACEYTAREVEEWMLAAGFRPRGDQWLVEEPDLGCLDPAEVSEIRPVWSDERMN